MEIMNALTENYAHQYTSDDDVLLQEVLQFTETHHAEKHMISGKVQGQFLQLVSNMLKPVYILEIGTFTGYSALCLAKGLQEQGKLHTIELRNNDAAIAQEFFNKSSSKEKIILHVGNAVEVIDTLPYEWDLVFIDADKVNYSTYYDLILPRVKKGGIIIADNVLFHGQVLEAEIKGKNAIAIHEFNNKVKSDHRVHHVMLTVRDGLMMIQKN
jgi:caffeoyl-CoA O-methyltransferase